MDTYETFINSLSPYQLFQLERYGNILDSGDPLEEFAGQDTRDIFTQEEAFVFDIYQKEGKCPKEAGW